MSTHKCPAPGCKVQVPAHQFACHKDWFRIPTNLRIDINAAWRERQSFNGRPAQERATANLAHLDAMAAAMRWLRDNDPTALPTCNCTGTVHPIGAPECVFNDEHLR